MAGSLLKARDVSKGCKPRPQETTRGGLYGAVPRDLAFARGNQRSFNEFNRLGADLQAWLARHRPQPTSAASESSRNRARHALISWPSRAPCARRGEMSSQRRHDDGDELFPKAHDATVPLDAAGTGESGGSSVRLRTGAVEAASEGAVRRVNEDRGQGLREIRGTGEPPLQRSIRGNPHKHLLDGPGNTRALQGSGLFRPPSRQ